jgi:hypothetical protein
VNIDLHETREDVPPGEEAVEVNPAARVERSNVAVVVYDGKFPHVGGGWEVLECVVPKGIVCHVGLWSDGQRLQCPLFCHWLEESLNERNNLVWSKSPMGISHAPWNPPGSVHAT